jgi:uncharacterized protein (DUF2235 family)
VSPVITYLASISPFQCWISGDGSKIFGLLLVFEFLKTNVRSDVHSVYDYNRGLGDAGIDLLINDRKRLNKIGGQLSIIACLTRLVLIIYLA